MAKVGPVAYQLALPTDTRMHDVFHVSLLKKQLKTKYSPSPVLPEVSVDGTPKVFPVCILQRRLTKFYNRTFKELLIHWSNLTPEEATWEQAATIHSQFPDFSLS